MYKTIPEILAVVKETCEKCGCSEIAEKFLVEFKGNFTSRMGDASTIGGKANNFKFGIIRFSTPIWKLATDAEKLQTIIHEVCHVIATYKYGYMKKAHGWEWQQIMLSAGVLPERCHKVDVAALKKKKTEYRVLCGCEKGCRISQTILNRLGNGAIYRCRRCGVTLVPQILEVL